MAPNLTEGDRKTMIMAWQCFKTTPQVDYEKLRQMGNYKTPASATACYLASRKKLLTGNGDKMTVRDREVITMAWECFKSKPEVDYKLLQQKGNYKTPASATACYLAVRKKLLGGGAAGEGSPSKAGSSAVAASPAKPRTGGTKRKVGKKAASEYDTNDKRIKLSEEADGDLLVIKAEEKVDEQLFETALSYLEEHGKVDEDGHVSSHIAAGSDEPEATDGDGDGDAGDRANNGEERV